MPKTFRTFNATARVERLGYESEEDMIFYQRKQAVFKMIDKLWGDVKHVGNSEVHSSAELFRMGDGGKLEAQERSFSMGRGVVKSRRITGVDAIVQYLTAPLEENEEPHRLQIVCPHDNKPHYLTFNAEKNTFDISEEAVPDRVNTARKPKWWESLLSFFIDVPAVTRYKRQQQLVDDFNDFCNTGKRIMKGSPDFQKAEDNKEKAVNGKDEKVENIIENEPEKDVIEKPVEKDWEVINEKPDMGDLSPEAVKKLEVFRQFVDQEVAKNPKLEGLGKNSVSSMRELLKFLENTRNNHNEEKSNYRDGLSKVAHQMATITEFNMALDNPNLELSQKNILLISRTRDFASVAGFISNDKEAPINCLEKEYVQAFVDTQGMNMSPKFEQISQDCHFPDKHQEIVKNNPVVRQNAVKNNNIHKDNIQINNFH